MRGLQVEGVVFALLAAACGTDDGALPDTSSAEDARDSVDHDYFRQADADSDRAGDEDVAESPDADASEGEFGDVVRSDACTADASAHARATGEDCRWVTTFRWSLDGEEPPLTSCFVDPFLLDATAQVVDLISDAAGFVLVLRYADEFGTLGDHDLRVEGLGGGPCWLDIGTDVRFIYSFAGTCYLGPEAAFAVHQGGHLVIGGAAVYGSILPRASDPVTGPLPDDYFGDVVIGEGPAIGCPPDMGPYPPCYEYTPVAILVERPPGTTPAVVAEDGFAYAGPAGHGCLAVGFGFRAFEATRECEQPARFAYGLVCDAPE